MGSIRDELAVVALRTLVYVVPLTTDGISAGPAPRRTIRVPVPSESSTLVAAGFFAANRTLAPMVGHVPAGQNSGRLPVRIAFPLPVPIIQSASPWREPGQQKHINTTRQ